MWITSCRTFLYGCVEAWTISARLSLHVLLFTHLDYRFKAGHLIINVLKNHYVCLNMFLNDLYCIHECNLLSSVDVFPVPTGSWWRVYFKGFVLPKGLPTLFVIVMQNLAIIGEITCLESSWKWVKFLKCVSNYICMLKVYFVIFKIASYK